MRVAGKIAVVVGAGQSEGETLGNGRATALLLAREGARVVCVDRVGPRAQDTAQAILAAGGDASWLAADVAKGPDCARIVAETVARHGRLDILVNNVGIGGGGDAPAHLLEEAVFDRILTVNLKGMWLTLKAAVPVMRAQGGGAIVNISSLAARSGGTQMAYEVSKAGVNRLTTSAALSNARHGVRVNAVMMGYLDTPMAISAIAAARGRPTAEVRAERDAQVPLRKRSGDAWDTAWAALFLASDEARFITGAILPVDGGMGI